MKKHVFLLNFSKDDGAVAVKDFYLVFRGKHAEDSLLLTSIRNFTLAIKSLTVNDLSIKTSHFISFLQIPLTSPTEFLLRAEVNGIRSILILSIKENVIQMEPATIYDELTDDMFSYILTCFTLKRENKYLSFLLQPNKGLSLATSNNQPDSDNNSVNFVKKPSKPKKFT
jgi:hypothetical protein